MRTTFVSGLVDLLLPVQCVGCGSNAGTLCPGCRPVTPPREADHGGLVVRAAASYQGGIRAALVAYKEHGRRDLAGPLAELLGGAVDAARGGARVVLVGVPTGRAAARARGGDHVARLVALVARGSGLPRAQPLRQVRPVRDSAALGVAARRLNVAGSMAAEPACHSEVALLIDDIVTTGSTLLEARRALLAAGWPVAGAAVVAATPRGPGAHPVHSPSPGTRTGTGLAWV